MSINIEEFSRVTFAKELQKVLSDIETKAQLVVAQSSLGECFQFQVREVLAKTPPQVGGVVHLQLIPPAPRALKEKEQLQILLGLPDGLYMVKSAVESIQGGSYSIVVGDEVYKLQRRNNFRATIPKSIKANMLLASMRNQPVPKGLLVGLIDLSAKGCRLNWSTNQLEAPSVGDRLSGTLQIQGVKSLEVFGEVKTKLAGSAGGHQLGVEFQNISQRDEQVLLVACMQFLRTQAPVI